MGIRFACHHCQKPLNIKRELAGKRGLCPTCGTRFRIPMDDAAYSIPVDSSQTHAPANGVDEPLNGFDASADAGQQDYAGDDAVRDPLAHVLVSANEPTDTRQAGACQSVDVSRERVHVVQETRHSSEAGFDSPQLPAAAVPTKPTLSLLDDPIAVWYVRPPSGGQYGPATGELLRTWISESRITAT